MPFTSENASEHAKKSWANGGRWRDKDPATNRSLRISYSVSPEENERISQKASGHGISRTELMVRAIDAYDPQPVYNEGSKKFKIEKLVVATLYVGAESDEAALEIAKLSPVSYWTVDDSLDVSEDYT